MSSKQQRNNAMRATGRERTRLRPNDPKAKLPKWKPPKVKKEKSRE